MRLVINGEQYTIEPSPSRPLLWVLRDELGLIGTKFGCGAGICGACTVQINGEAQRSCITPIETVADAEIRTIEGLATRNADGALQLHPVQQAFLDTQAPQCSWCMSGQMMNAAALLETTPHPTEAEIIAAMSRNYCRCGCYVRIKTAVIKAAELMALTRGSA